MFDDLGFDDAGICLGRGIIAEVDFDDAVAIGLRRRQRLSAAPIQVPAGVAKSKSQSTRSTTRLAPSAASRSSIFLPTAQNSA